MCRPSDYPPYEDSSPEIFGGLPERCHSLGCDKEVSAAGLFYCLFHHQHPQTIVYKNFHFDWRGDLVANNE